MAKLKHAGIRLRLEGSTLLEVIVSMVVIIFVFGIALMILTNVMRLSLSDKQLRADGVLKQEFLKSVSANNLSDQTSQIQDFRIVKAVSPYGSEEGLLVVDLIAYDNNGKIIAESKNLISRENK